VLARALHRPAKHVARQAAKRSSWAVGIKAVRAANVLRKGLPSIPPSPPPLDTEHSGAVSAAATTDMSGHSPNPAALRELYRSGPDPRPTPRRQQFKRMATAPALLAKVPTLRCGLRAAGRSR
jgi:hypothetical protein